jgi:hypothetical protein
VSHPEHCQILIFCTDIPFKRLSDLQMVLSKFPNLEELCIDTVEDVVHLESFLNSIKSTHPQLQKLSWTFNAELTVHELCDHLVRLPEVLPALTSYSLERNDRLCQFWSTFKYNVEETTDIRFNMPTNSNSDDNNPCFLSNVLLMKHLVCECKLEEKSDLDGWNVNCEECYLYKFIKTHNLNILIPSPEEIYKIGRKYIWDHRFASSSTYK